MIYRVPPYDPDAPVVVIDIGNTQTGIATWHGDQLKMPVSLPTDDHEAFDRAFAAHVEEMARNQPAATVIGSVVPPALERIRTCVLTMRDQEPLVVGESVPLPMEVGVTDAKAIGVDRVCAAAAAFEKVEAGCTVVDFGTAVTVDLVDDQGTLCGGAILPGLEMQLRALHEYTAVLPAVEPGMPELPYGRNTVEAMQTGVCRGVAGAVRSLVEAYAASLNHWPQVIASGGDLAFMAPHCDFLDTLVKDLTLRGIGVAYRKYMTDMGA
jgi:type III pantothenate kinase